MVLVAPITVTGKKIQNCETIFSKKASLNEMLAVAGE
jgi:hypothetical protein